MISMPLADIMPDRRRAVRAPINPLDKSTIVSIYPRRIIERKPTIFPGEFTIESGTFEKPSLLVVGASSWFRDIDPKQPIIEYVCGSMEVANSIVNDYISSLGHWSPEGKPGIFFIPGEVDSLKLKKDFTHLLISAREKQQEWFRMLVTMGDALWSLANGNPRAISEDVRFAAQELGIAKTKMWMGDFNTRQLENCPACGFMRHGNFPVCQNCHTVIDRKKFEELGLVQQVK